ncbi:hypothetical protein BDF19DRAFT_463898 [Syncephalis fuscata]|nr:hypothetical protein BDF19DRAFT_463898 [Syncephalis fuscata]
MECIICYEPFPGESQGLLSPVAAMPCGHIFIVAGNAIRCLNVSRKCPTCRRQPIRIDNLIYLYGDWESIKNNQNKQEAMKRRIDELLNSAATEKEAHKNEIEAMRAELNNQKEFIVDMNSILDYSRQGNIALKARLNETSIKLKQKTEEAQEYHNVAAVKKLLKKPLDSEVQDSLKRYAESDQSTQHLVVMTLLDEMSEMRSELAMAKYDLENERQLSNEMGKKMDVATTQLCQEQAKIHSLNTIKDGLQLKLEQTNADFSKKLKAMERSMYKWLANAAIQKQAHKKELEITRAELYKQTKKIEHMNLDLNDKCQENVALKARLNETSVELNQKADEIQKYHNIAAIPKILQESFDSEAQANLEEYTKSNQSAQDLVSITLFNELNELRRRLAMTKDQVGKEKFYRNAAEIRLRVANTQLFSEQTRVRLLNATQEALKLKLEQTTKELELAHKEV